MSLPGLPPEGQPYAEFLEAAGAKTGVGPYLLAAICARESCFGLTLNPKGPAGTGDDGHGRGLMQLDDRTWRAFCLTDKWQDPAENILFAASYFAHLLCEFGWDEFVALAAYNAGPGRIERALETCCHLATEQRNHVLDSYTTGRDYANDTLRRRDKFLANAGNQPAV